MRVLAFNGSPKMEKSNTSLVLDPFLEGMKEAGAKVELFYTKKLKVSPCQGERSCSTITPGECIQKDDDMAMLYPKLRQAEVWVFATPVYWGRDDRADEESSGPYGPAAATLCSAKRGPGKSWTKAEAGRACFQLWLVGYEHL